MASLRDYKGPRDLAAVIDDAVTALVITPEQLGQHAEPDEAFTVDLAEPTPAPEARPIPYNLVTGKEYAGGNIMRLAIAEAEHDYTDGGWAGFAQWLTVGRVVRKGEHSTVIAAMGSKTTENADGTTTTVSFPGKARRVFHYDQTTELEQVTE